MMKKFLWFFLYNLVNNYCNNQILYNLGVKLSTINENNICCNKEETNSHLINWKNKYSLNIQIYYEDYINNIISIFENKQEIQRWVNSLDRDKFKYKINNNNILFKYLEDSHTIFKIIKSQIQYNSFIRKNIFTKLCDHNNQKFIFYDYILVSQKFCKNLINDSFEYLKLQNEIFLPYVINLIKWTNEYLKSDEIFNYEYKFNKYFKCFGVNSIDYSKCKDICTDFNFNSISKFLDPDNFLLIKLLENLKSVNIIKLNKKIFFSKNPLFFNKNLNFSLSVANKGINFLQKPFSLLTYQITKHHNITLEQLNNYSTNLKSSLIKDPLNSEYKILDQQFLKKYNLNQEKLQKIYKIFYILIIAKILI